MLKKVRKSQLASLVVDLGLTLLALWLAKVLRETLPFGVTLGPAPLPFSPWLFVIVVGVWSVVFTTLGVYGSASPFRRTRFYSRVCGATTGASFTFAGVCYLLFRDLSRLLFGYFYLLDLIFLCGWRLMVATLFVGAGHPQAVTPRRILIVGINDKAQRLAEAIQAQANTDLILIGFVQDSSTATGSPALPVLGTPADVPHLIAEHQIQEIVFSTSPATEPALKSLVLRLQNASVNLRLIVDAFDLAFLRSPVEEYQGIPLTTLNNFPV